MSFIFTYWEGKKYPFTNLCINSITKIFGERHIHLTPISLQKWINLSPEITNTKHLLFRSDYIRTALLEKYGGWWFDTDVLLIRDPSSLVADNKPQIWNLIYIHNGAWTPLVNCGILYTPKSSLWITRIINDFNKINPLGLEMTKENEDIGQDIYEKWSINTGLCNIGCEYKFNSTVNVNADYKPFWDGTITFDSIDYGIHIGASLSRWAAKDGDYRAHKILTHSSLQDLVFQHPKSVVAQYIREFL